MTTAVQAAAQPFPRDRAGQTAACDSRLFAGAAGLLVLELVMVRAAVELDAAWIMSLPVLVLTALIARRSPPLAALSLLYGWPLFAAVDLPPVAGAPHFPFISILTVWTLFCLLYRRSRDGTLRFLRQPVVLGYVALMAAFLAVGIASAWFSSLLVNPVLRFLNWDIARSWLGFLLLALLGVRGMRDARALFTGLPLAFLAFPICLPLDVWRTFFSAGLGSDYLMNIGLSHGSLNPNTFGQAASLSAVSAAAIALASRSRRLRRLLFLGAGLCAAIAFATFSRQALLGLVFGMVAISLALGFRRKLFLIGALVCVLAGFVFVLVNFVPADVGFRNRLLEVFQRPGSWASMSAQYRIEELSDSVEQWTRAPIFGVGFGGQKFERVQASFGSDTAEDDSELSLAVRGGHNLFVAVLTQTGVVGLSLLLVFLLGILGGFLDLGRREGRFPESDGRAVRVATWGTVVCLVVEQSISGGVGMGSSALVFLWGAMLAVLGAAQASGRLASRGRRVFSRTRAAPAGGA